MLVDSDDQIPICAESSGFSQQRPYRHHRWRYDEKSNLNAPHEVLSAKHGGSTVLRPPNKEVNTTSYNLVILYTMFQEFHGYRTGLQLPVR